MRKKEQGLSLVELMLAIAVSTMGIVGASSYLQKSNNTKAMTALKEDLVKEHIYFTRALSQYVEENKNSNLPNTVTRDFLFNNGYLPEIGADGFINDGVDALGFEIVGKIASPYGFTQSVGVLQEGNIDTDIAKRYGLLNKEGDIEFSKIESLYNNIAIDVAELDLEYTTSVITPKGGAGYDINRPFSNEQDELHDFFDRSYINISDSLPTIGTFINLQKNPGYAVVEYNYYFPTHLYGGPSGMELDIEYKGYSDFCPSPGNVIPSTKTTPSNNVIIGNKTYEEGQIEEQANFAILGELNGSYNVCMPASKTIVSDTQKPVNLSPNLYTTDNVLGCTNGGRQASGYENRRKYAVVSAITYHIGDLDYSVVLKGASQDLNCQGSNQGNVYMKGLLINGELRNNINVVEVDAYGDNITGVPTRDFNL